MAANDLFLTAEQININPRRPTLGWITFKLDHLADFTGLEPLRRQIGHNESDWPCVVLKELCDNAADACWRRFSKKGKRRSKTFFTPAKQQMVRRAGLIP
jgi:hypothetical protein